jgi:hypothetical protein
VSQQAPTEEGAAPAPEVADECEPGQVVIELKADYEDKKAEVESAQKKLDKMKTDLNDLEKMSQDIEQALQEHVAGKEQREDKFQECHTYADCKREIVDGTVPELVKDEVKAIVATYEADVDEKGSECVEKHDALAEAERARQQAETDEQERLGSHEGNKALVEACLAECDDLKTLFENAEETCDYKLMYFLAQELEAVVEEARTTCVYSDPFQRLLCDSWDELRKAKDVARQAREAEDLARRQMEKCDVEFDDLTRDRRGALRARLAATASS